MGFEGDAGSRGLADQVLTAVASGDRGGVAELLDMLDVDQLRSLVSVLADRAAPARPARRPAVSAGEVCAAAITAAAEAFGTSPEVIMGPARQQAFSDARAVAMTVARHVGLSLPAIAEHFGKDHGSVIHAVRRAQGRPRLAAEATRIGEELNSRYLAVLGRDAAAGPSTNADVDAAAADAAASSPSSPSPASPAPWEVFLEHAVATAARVFETTPSELLGTDRARAATDARAVAMTAARMRGQSLPAIARHFSRDHTTVLHATRRIARTPPLRALAERIAAGGPETGEPPNRMVRPSGEPWDPAASYRRAAGEPSEAGLPSPPRRLGVAR